MTPEPLPEPPHDYGVLAADFPAIHKESLPAYCFRVHRIDRPPEWFSSDSSNRWDPPSAGAGFGTCYVAETKLVAFAEVFGGLPLVTDEMVAARCIATVDLPGGVKLADMSSGHIVGRWRLDTRISVGDDYPVCQRWANALHLAGFAGIYYSARHDPRHGYDDMSVALFGDAGYQPTQLGVVNDGEALGDDLLREAREQFGIRVLPTTAI